MIFPMCGMRALVRGEGGEAVPMSLFGRMTLAWRISHPSDRTAGNYVATAS